MTEVDRLRRLSGTLRRAAPGADPHTAARLERAAACLAEAADCLAYIEWTMDRKIEVTGR